MGYLRCCTYYLGLVFFIGAGSLFALTTSSPDSTFFTTSYKTQQESRNKYHQDAIIGFSGVLNRAIKNHPTLKSLSDSCGGCDVIAPEFDEYLKRNFPILDDDSKQQLRKKLRSKSYGAIVAGNYLHQSIGRNLSQDMIKALDDFIVEALVSVVEDTNYQTRLHTDIKSPGEYTDGDTKNSPYDLINDMQKISRLLFGENIEYEGYLNTMDNDASGLITGRFQKGEWAQGESYELDLASDVISAFGQDGESGSGSSDDGDDCEDGFCITLDFILNDSYMSGGGTSFVDKNFEEIFGSGLDWLVKKGDKRNLACKGPPPVNFFQSNNDLNLSFKNIFRGLGIFVFQKTPKYAKSDGGSEEEKTAEEQEKEMDGVIETSLKKYKIDPENLLIHTQEQMVEEATPLAQKAIDSANNQDRAQTRLNMDRSASVSAHRDEAGNPDSGTKNMVRSLGSSMQSFGTMLTDLQDVVTVWNDKPDCKN